MDSRHLFIWLDFLGAKQLHTVWPVVITADFMTHEHSDYTKLNLHSLNWAETETT